MLIVAKALLAILSLTENARLRLALVIPTGATIILANEAPETLQIVANKISKVLLK